MVSVTFFSCHHCDNEPLSWDGKNRNTVGKFKLWFVINVKWSGESLNLLQRMREKGENILITKNTWCDSVCRAPSCPHRNPLSGRLLCAAQQSDLAQTTWKWISRHCVSKSYIQETLYWFCCIKKNWKIWIFFREQEESEIDGLREVATFRNTILRCITAFVTAVFLF